MTVTPLSIKVGQQNIFISFKFFKHSIQFDTDETVKTNLEEEKQYVNLDMSDDAARQWHLCKFGRIRGAEIDDQCTEIEANSSLISEHINSKECLVNSHLVRIQFRAKGFSSSFICFQVWFLQKSTNDPNEIEQFEDVVSGIKYIKLILQRENGFNQTLKYINNRNPNDHHPIESIQPLNEISSKAKIFTTIAIDDPVSRVAPTQTPNMYNEMNSKSEIFTTNAIDDHRASRVTHADIPHIYVEDDVTKKPLIFTTHAYDDLQGPPVTHTHSPHAYNEMTNESELFSINATEDPHWPPVPQTESPHGYNEITNEPGISTTNATEDPQGPRVARIVGVTVGIIMAVAVIGCVIYYVINGKLCATPTLTAQGLPLNSINANQTAENNELLEQYRIRTNRRPHSDTPRCLKVDKIDSC